MDKMASTPDGDGSLLDSTIIHFGKEYGNGSTHSAVDLPIVLFAGNQCGIQGGRFMQLPPATAYANLLLTEINQMGVSQQTFGDDGDELIW